MQIELSRTLFAPLHYWRTVLLVPIVGLSIAILFRDATAVLFSTLACAFVFSGYERRRWIVVPPQVRVVAMVLRLSFAFAVTYVLCSAQSPLFA